MARKPRILVIDDEPTINQVISLTLEAQGWTVERAFDGHEAVQKFKEFRPDALVLDVMMPKENGYKVSRMIKTLLASKAPKILLVTARRVDDQEGREEAVMEFAKADAVIYKPFYPQEIVDQLRSLLETGTEQPEGAEKR
ncbi:MAG TPA: response regulator transcription factor [Candidatus Polarisedimenticolaceae bacterium]|nr:response regulator transcription factor [Candidatus Polarisedimenticolaceae bacterium]